MIANLKAQTRDCTLWLDTVQAVDTGTNTHQALETVAQKLPVTPDAIAGPYSEFPALELSVALGTGFQTPIVSHRAQSYNLLLPNQHPYFSQLGADVETEMKFVATFLETIVQRTDYIAILHSATPSIVQKVQILQRILRDRRRRRRLTSTTSVFTQVRTFSYNPKYLNLDSTSDNNSDESLQSTLQDIQETGFRTIVWLPSFMIQEAIELGPIVTQAGLDINRFWATVEGLDHRNGLEYADFSQNALTTYKAQFLNGSVYLYPFDGYSLHPTIDFRDFLFQQDSSFFQRVIDLLPHNNTSIITTTLSL